MLQKTLRNVISEFDPSKVWAVSNRDVSKGFKYLGRRCAAWNRDDDFVHRKKRDALKSAPLRDVVSS